MYTKHWSFLPLQPFSKCFVNSICALKAFMIDFSCRLLLRRDNSWHRRLSMSFIVEKYLLQGSIVRWLGADYKHSKVVDSYSLWVDLPNLPLTVVHSSLYLKPRSHYSGVCWISWHMLGHYRIRINMSRSHHIVWTFDSALPQHTPK